MKKAETILVLPAAGRAVRMGGIAKELLPFGQRLAGGRMVPSPVLAEALEAGIEAGAERCLVVTSSSKAASLMQAISGLDIPLPVSYLHQNEPAGLAWAVECARAHVPAGDIALMLMPDTVMRPTGVIAKVTGAVKAGALVCASLFRVAHPKQFGVAEFDSAGSVVGFIDKPEFPASNWIWTSIAFRTGFFAYIEKALALGLDLSGALDLAAKDGTLAIEVAHGGCYWDLGTYDGYLRALNTAAVRRSNDTDGSGFSVAAEPAAPMIVA